MRITALISFFFLLALTTQSQTTIFNGSFSIREITGSSPSYTVDGFFQSEGTYIGTDIQEGDRIYFWHGNDCDYLVVDTVYYAYANIVNLGLSDPDTTFLSIPTGKGLMTRLTDYYNFSIPFTADVPDVLKKCVGGKLINEIDQIRPQTSFSADSIFLDTTGLTYINDTVLQVALEQIDSALFDINDSLDSIPRGEGTANTFPLWTGSTTLGNSQLTWNTTYSRFEFGGTSSIKLPVGTTAQRSSVATTGELRWNTSTGYEEIYTGSAWTQSSFPTGTSGQTLYNNGSAWIANSRVTYNSSNDALYVGQSTPEVDASNTKFQVFTGAITRAHIIGSSTSRLSVWGKSTGTGATLNLNSGGTTAPAQSWYISNMLGTGSVQMLNIGMRSGAFGDAGDGDIIKIRQDNKWMSIGQSSGAAAIPLYPLHVVGNATDVFAFDGSQNPEVGVRAGLLFKLRSKNPPGDIGQVSYAGIYTVVERQGNTEYSGGLAFYTANAASFAERLRIDSVGRIGINTVPSYALDINRTTAIRLPRGSSTDETGITQAAGLLRYDRTLSKFRISDSLSWKSIASEDWVTANFSAPISLTASQVVFGGSTGGMSQTANFLYDSTNTRLGVGITPLYSIHTSGDIATETGIIRFKPSGTQMYFWEENDTTIRLDVETNGRFRIRGGGSGKNIYLRPNATLGAIITSESATDLSFFAGNIGNAESGSYTLKLVASNQAVQLAGYGTGTKTATLLSKTRSGLVLAPATDGTVYETGGVLFTQIEADTVSNTASETSLIATTKGSTILPADYLEQGRDVQCEAWGTVTTSGSPPSLELKLKLGSTGVWESGSFSMIDLSAGVETWHSSVSFTTYTSGSSGTVMPAGEFSFSVGGDPSFGKLIRPVYASPVTVNTTTSQTLDFTATWGSADPNASIIMTKFVCKAQN